MAKAQPHPDYDVSDDTYSLKRQNIKDKHWNTEIGDRRITNKFVPRIKYQRFDDGFLEIGVPNGLHGGGDSVTHEGNTIVWQRQIYTARFYDWEGDPDGSEGGSYEWELVLASVPPTNSLTLDLRRQNVSMLYQAPLTPEEIANGDERPDRVEGSYAIYHTQKRNHRPGEINYEMGKIGHLYRPLCTDDNGDTIWGEWNDDAETSGELTLTVDAAWLTAAAYPVTIDPTFGYTTIGGTPGTITDYDHYVLWNNYTHNDGSAQNIDKSSAYCYVLADTGRNQIVVNTWAKGATVALTTLHTTSSTLAVTNTSGAWLDLTHSGTLSASTDYIVSIQGHQAAVGRLRIYRDTSTWGDVVKLGDSDLTPPSDLTGAANTNFLASVYITYSAAGGADKRVMVVS